MGLRKVQGESLLHNSVLHYIAEDISITVADTKNKNVCFTHVVIRSANPQLSKKVLSLHVEEKRLQNFIISCIPNLITAALVLPPDY